MESLETIKKFSLKSKIEMNKNTIFLFAIAFILLSQTIYAQRNDRCGKSLVYENHNQINPEPLSLTSLSGIVKDEKGIPFVEACIGIFNKNKKLITTISTGEEGEFSLDSLKQGNYILVVEFYPYCSANIPIKILKKSKKDKEKQKSISVIMKIQGTDDCSYGTYQ